MISRRPTRIDDNRRRRFANNRGAGNLIARMQVAAEEHGRVRVDDQRKPSRSFRRGRASVRTGSTVGSSGSGIVPTTSTRDDNNLNLAPGMPITVKLLVQLFVARPHNSPSVGTAAR